MALHTQQSLSGFIASEPQQSITENGDTCFYVRIGQPHFRREDDGTFSELEPTFHDLVAYRTTADRALTRFAKGDSFIAEGYVRTFQVERNGTSSNAKNSSRRRSATTSPAPTMTSTVTAGRAAASNRTHRSGVQSSRRRRCAPTPPRSGG